MSDKIKFLQKIIRHLMVSTFTILLLASQRNVISIAHAVSLIDPYRPGVTAANQTPSSHALSLSVLSSEKYLEVPFHIFYGITDDLELETRWGFIYNSPEAGMSDMKFSVKYNFKFFDRYSLIVSDKEDLSAGISGEAGITLPTGDHTKGLGAGGVGIMLGWNIRQVFEKNILGFLGLSGEFNNHELIDESSRRSSRIFSYTAGARYLYNDDLTFIMELKGFNNYFSKAMPSSSDFYQELYLSPGVFYKGKNNLPITSASILIGLTPDARKIIFYAEKKF